MEDSKPLPDPKPFELSIPCRFSITRRNHSEALAELDRMAAILVRGCDALSGLYLRITDSIRQHGLTDDEIRSTLGKHFPPPRVSEFIRVANAPDAVYRRYRLGIVGFKAILLECRGYHIHTSEELKTKKIRRAAERLISLIGEGQVEVCGKRVTVA